METAEASQKILDTMLGHLGVPATIDIESSPEGFCLQIQTAEEDAVIGRDGERLDDIQYLVNRILRRQFPKADRIKVDCGHFRTMREDKLAAEIRMVAERVKETGEPKQLRPLNAYYRRIVHNILINDPDVETHSPSGDDRLKRITIRRKSSPAQLQ